MILTLIRKELLTNLLTLRLAVAVGFTVVLSVLTTFIGSLNYSQNLEAYQKEVRDVAEALDKASIYSQVEPPRRPATSAAGDPLPRALGPDRSGGVH